MTRPTTRSVARATTRKTPAFARKHAKWLKRPAPLATCRATNCQAPIMLLRTTGSALRARAKVTRINGSIERLKPPFPPQDLDGKKLSHPEFDHHTPLPSGYPHLVRS